MYRKILIILGLLFFSACSQNKPEVKDKIVIKKIVKVKVKNETPKEFIPEHIKRSKIEVVKHY